MHVTRSKDDTVILGVNTLPLLGYKLVQEKHDRKRGGRKLHEAVEFLEPDHCIHVESEQPQFAVAGRVYVPPGATKEVQVTTLATEICPERRERSTRGSTTVLVHNAAAGPLVLPKGKPITKLEEVPSKWIDVSMKEIPTDMLVKKKKNLDPSERLEMLHKYLAENRHDERLPEDIWDLVKRNNEVFAVEDRELTQTSLVAHEIIKDGTKPIKQKTRPVPIGARSGFRDILKDLLERRIIQKSDSEWASPVVLVRKKDGTLRLCIDYRELNKHTKLDAYPLPLIDGMLQSLQNKRIFSTLDMASGYWQIPLSDEAKQKTAFTTSEGLYEFRVLPFLHKLSQNERISRLHNRIESSAWNATEASTK